MTTPPKPNDDVRMKGFAQRSTVADVLTWLDRHTTRLAAETVPVQEVAGRVLADGVTSRVNVPPFARSMMDGFALRADDTQGASSYSPLALDVIGQSLPGAPYDGKVSPGRAVRIMTGAPIPEGADAVLPVEFVEIEPGFKKGSGTVAGTAGHRPKVGQVLRTTVPDPFLNHRILTLKSVSPGQHVGQIGEDIQDGTPVLPAGRRLRPQDVGVLSSIGEGRVSVVRRPRVRIVVTGNELLPAGSMPKGCKIADSNGPMLAGLVERDGGLVLNPGIVPDRPDAILDAMRTDADVVLVSGGSSVGQEDHAPALLAEHGQLAIHGIAMRPSSPTGMGLLDGRLVFLLPGNPVSCLSAYDFFAGRALRVLGGRSADWPYRRIVAPLGRKIVSTVGRQDYLRVRLADGQVDPLAIGGSSILSSTTRADGFVLIDPDKEGYPPGAEVEVFLYD
jgi:molybdopterin molybdotransferase